MSLPVPQHPPPRHRHPGRTLYLYLARESLRPALFALLGLTAVMLTTDILGFSDLVINRGVGAGDVAKMVFYTGVPVAARMLPFACFVGSLVALGRLGADREILALESSGVAAARLVWPMVSFAGVMTILALWLSVWATPWASGRFDAALEQVSRSKPWAQLRAGTVNEFGGWQLQAREVSASGKALKGVLLWIPEIGETIFARGGDLEAEASGAIQITLHEAAVLLRPQGGEVRMLHFDTATTVLPESDRGLTRNELDRIPELPLHQLVEQARSWRPTERDRMPRAALALQRRFATPLATLVFGFLAVPLFLARRNFSRASGGVMGLVCTVFYYGLMQFSDGLVQAGTVGVVLGAWLPNLLLGGLATVLLLRALRERVVGHDFDRSRRFGSRLPGRRGEAGRSRPHRYALPRYVGGRFLRLVGLCFSVIFVAYFLIDVMDRLSWFSKHQATMIEVLRFYGARIWLLASRSVPMAILMATALCVSLMAVEGELIGMRACGISALRSTLPVLALSLLLAPFYFLLNNVVVPRTNALADELKRVEIKDDVAAREAREAGLWYRAGHLLLEASFFDSERGQGRDLTIYELGDDGLPESRTDAARGRHIGQGWWRLTGATRVEVHDGVPVEVKAPRHSQLGEAVAAEVDTMQMPVNRIAAEARSVEADGFDATPFWVDYNARLAEPLSCVALPALVLFFAAGGPPFPGPAQTLLLSAILGVSYILLVAVSSTLGRGGALPPALSGWGPIGIFSAIALGLFARIWRRR